MRKRSFDGLAGIDFYRLARPLLFRLDPETAHGLAISLLKKGLGPKDKSQDPDILHTSVCGLDFPNPLGLAAGFDKQCEVIAETLDFGFGFVECGGVVPLPQPGNPRPRLFRLAEAEGAINRFDFNSDGFDACLRRVAAWRDTAARQKTRGVVGVNIAKGNHYEDAAAAYSLGLEKFAPYVDFVTVNISCPNTAGLRNLEGREQLSQLLARVMEARGAPAKKPRVLVKISPDQSEAQMQDIAEVVLASGVDALIVGNTTTSRPGALPENAAREAGGLSGKPLFALSTRVLGEMYKLTQGKIPLIGVGGVFSGADAYAKIRAGASLVQLYTALIYEGPGLVKRIKRGLAALLQRDGFKSVGEAVGAGQKR
ncbi:MAG TPA: quinone-dependent dihydroorotate dehydrogenase [Alphaproteobacteria bacterium]|nr:quinone-dependent dihydroorotate dehydrogenase [Alphaproteobacteria bacterium]